ncbi:serine hydrolase [Flavobacterium sp. GA093]|uniref:Serine hydrolase n=1 Tax=Flavobacterium hydrocarbonoxydans TaxID=2683249 RepID=A0A6I4NP30_9FLAO|nr:serine hydrolase domain-containing protein [Flavobacterium hydrocarbonoxydans]MWB96206.1 serine hydrolase [Flavobacterium hydrocarbonoxydans]
MNATLKLSALFSILFLVSNSIVTAQKKDSYPVIDSIVSLSKPTFNGVVLISKNGKTVYSKANGYANFETKTPIQVDSQFEIMSNSKQIAAVLILKEVELGRISLQAPIKKYLPELTQTWADSVTVHQLMNHTHGIIALEKPLIFKPGTDFKYGNLSFSLLGKIVEFSTRKKYDEVANALFLKLNMKKTYCYSRDKVQNVVSGYINDNNVFERVQNSQITNETLGADGVVSTAGDLAIWNDNLHKGKILKPETYALMLKYNTTSQHNFFGKQKEGYGYGIRIIEKESEMYLGHTGLGDGFSTVNLYFPEGDMSLIILENQMFTNHELFYINEIKIKNNLLKSNIADRNR